MDPGPALTLLGPWLIPLQEGELGWDLLELFVRSSNVGQPKQPPAWHMLFHGPVRICNFGELYTNVYKLETTEKLFLQVSDFTKTIATLGTNWLPY